MENLWYLQERDFFAELEEQRQRFLGRAIRKTLPKNEIVFFEGDTGDSCFYVASGLVRIFSITDSGKESIFFLRRPGELFGLSEVLNAFPRRANAQTLMPTELYVMPSGTFDSLLAEDYALARRVITMLGSRVRYLGDRLSNLATGSVMSRLIKLLISLVYDLLPDAEAWERPVALPVRISQEQLASMTGSTQPTVSDLLQKLHKAGGNRRRLNVVRRGPFSAGLASRLRRSRTPAYRRARCRRENRARPRRGRRPTGRVPGR